MRPLLGLIHFFLSRSPARWISPIFHPSHLGLHQGCAVPSILFNMCEAICQNSGPKASPAPTPGRRQDSASFCVLASREVQAAGAQEVGVSEQRS